VNDIGDLIKPNYITQHFEQVLKKNGLRKITFHELRHNCASLLLKSGVPMKEIQEWLGHSSYSTTANIYAHLDAATKEDNGFTMAEKIDISGALNQAML
jgi:integrase